MVPCLKIPLDRYSFPLVFMCFLLHFPLAGLIIYNLTWTRGSLLIKYFFFSFFFFSILKISVFRSLKHKALGYVYGLKKWFSFIFMTQIEIKTPSAQNLERLRSVNKFY